MGLWKSGGWMRACSQLCRTDVSAGRGVLKEANVSTAQGREATGFGRVIPPFCHARPRCFHSPVPDNGRPDSPPVGVLGEPDGRPGFYAIRGREGMRERALVRGFGASLGGLRPLGPRPSGGPREGGKLGGEDERARATRAARRGVPGGARGARRWPGRGRLDRRSWRPRRGQWSGLGRRSSRRPLRGSGE